MSAINEILNERGNRYGDFASNATTTQMIKHALSLGENAHNLTYAQREALDMIAHKMSRIVNGDADYIDSWVDIIGYAQLVIDRLKLQQSEENEEISGNTADNENTPEIAAQLQRLEMIDD
jgi:hypothetical protein